MKNLQEPINGGKTRYYKYLSDLMAWHVMSKLLINIDIVLHTNKNSALVDYIENQQNKNSSVPNSVSYIGNVRWHLNRIPINCK